jgi:hypothetical protein
MSKPASEVVLLVLTEQARIDPVQQVPLHVPSPILALILHTEEVRNLLKNELIGRQ